MIFHLNADVEGWLTMRTDVRRFLLFDDHDTMGATVCNTAGLNHEQVVHIHDRFDALVFDQFHSFDLFLIDYQLSDTICGTHVSDDLRQRYPCVPQIMITAYRTDAVVNACLERGLLLVEKPFMADKLNRAIRYLLEYLPAFQSGETTGQNVPAGVVESFAAPDPNRKWRPQDCLYTSGQVYADFFGEITALAAGMVNDHEAREDIVQEAYFRLWKQNPELSNGWEFLSRWKTTAVNCCYDWHRRKKREGKHIEFAGGLPDVEAPSPTPQDALAEREDIAALQEQIDSLPPHYRRVIELRSEGKSYRQIAEIMELREKQIDNILSYVKKKWKETQK